MHTIGFGKGDTKVFVSQQHSIDVFLALLMRPAFCVEVILSESDIGVCGKGWKRSLAMANPK